MEINFLAVFLAALVTLPVGVIWYNEKVFGAAWMKGIGKTKEELRPGNMIVTMLLSIFCAFLVAFMLQPMVIHQFHLMSILADDPELGTVGSASYNELAALMEKYGNKFRTFKHGAFHGFLTGLLFILPITAVSHMYEKRNFKTIMINAGYWIVSLTIMGGIICGWR